MSDRQYREEAEEARTAELNDTYDRLDREQGRLPTHLKDPNYGRTQWQIDNERAHEEADELPGRSGVDIDGASESGGIER